MPWSITLEFATDMDLQVFSGATCGSLTSIACTDGGSTIPGSNTFDAGLFLTGQAPGSTLWIRAWQYSGGQGTFDLCAWDPNIPNDDPCTATTLGVGCSGTIYSQPTFATWTNSAIAAPSCGNYGGRDTWFQADVAASGNLSVEVFDGTLTDCAMAFYTSSGACSGALTEISCDANSGTGNMPKISITGYTPGQVIYVRVWDENDDETGTFSIEATDADAVFCLNGNGVDLGGGCAQLTANTTAQQSSIWDANDVLNFNSDFSYDFEVMLGSNNSGADGIAFVIQNDPAGRQATGIPGGDLGAGGILNSLIFEIDTYLNTEDRDDGMPTTACSGGAEPDHLDIWLNGNINPNGVSCPGSPGARIIPNAVELLNGAVAYNIENGLRHTFRLSYTSATKTITATILDLAGATTYGTVSYSPVDTSAIFGTGTPFFGFTGSTGGLFNEQYACLDSNLWLLPVKFINLEVDCLDKGTSVSWKTSQIEEHSSFIVQKSMDGIIFNDVSEISAKIGETQFTWTDKELKNGYYRIKLKEENGNPSYSVTKKAFCEFNDLRILYTSQIGNELILNINSSINQEVLINLIDLNGKIIKSENITLSKGINNKYISIDNMSAGMYYTSLNTPSESIGIKIIIK